MTCSYVEESGAFLEPFDVLSFIYSRCHEVEEGCFMSGGRRVAFKLRGIS